jgi:hypothetical protein
MYARYYAADIAQWAVGPERADAVTAVLRGAFLIPPVLGALVLVALAGRPWRELRAGSAAEPAAT